MLFQVCSNPRNIHSRYIESNGLMLFQVVVIFLHFDKLRLQI